MKLSLPRLTGVSLALASCSSAGAVQQKQAFHITGPRELFDAFYHTNKESLDLWSAMTHSDGTIEAEVYGSPSMVSQFQGSHARGLREGDHTHRLRFLAAAGATDTSSAAKKEKLDVSTCHKETEGYIDVLGAGHTAFTTSEFHDCWRTSTQVFEFLDKLTKLAPTHLTKIDSIGKTFEGRDIPVYKISTEDKGKKKQALVGQALIHSREWQTGGAVFYIISGLLDGLRAKDKRVTAIFDKYDWYFVPILNIDGYEHTWTDGNRLWRKNRRTFTVDGKNFVGVDLNRNFGPAEFFDLTGDSKRPNTEIYPGTGVLSEPESAAVFRFLRTLPTKLAGLIDVHMNSQSVLRPFSNQVTEAAEPYHTKLIDLGGVIQRAIQHGSDLEYRNVMGGTGSYLAYGTFKDAVYMELGGVPAYTLELERADSGFISSQTTIRDVGNRTLSAFLAFSEGVEAYWRE